MSEKTREKPISEQTVRSLRAIIYGECSDSNWEACKENWMRADSVEWLGDEAAKIIQPV
jgi:hypothetical protein